MDGTEELSSGGSVCCPSRVSHVCVLAWLVSSLAVFLTSGGSLGDGCVVGAALRVEWSVGSGIVLSSGGSSGGVVSRRRPAQLQANLEEVKAKDVLRDMLAKTHRLVH